MSEPGVGAVERLRAAERAVRARQRSAGEEALQPDFGYGQRAVSIQRGTAQRPAGAEPVHPEHSARHPVLVERGLEPHRPFGPRTGHFGLSKRRRRYDSMLMRLKSD